MKLTHEQRALAFIRREVKAGRGVPTQWTLNRHLGYAESSAAAGDIFHRLVVRGVLDRSDPPPNDPRRRRHVYTLREKPAKGARQPVGVADAR